jgi:murein DD-endopeptidase MepM/ murein hydrolase activator NlpD
MREVLRDAAPTERTPGGADAPAGGAASKGSGVVSATSGTRAAALREPPPPRRLGDREVQGLEVMPLGRPVEPPAISPRMTAVFGGLFGMAVVASIFALLIQVFPVPNQRGAAAPSSSASSESAEASARPRPKKRERKLLPSPWRVAALEKSHHVVKGEMKRRSFIVALDESGVPKKEIYRILKAFEGIRDFEKTGKSDRYAVAMKRGTKEIEAFEYQIDAAEIYQARTGKDGLLRGERLDMKVREEEYATAFYIGKDLDKSYRHVGLEKGLLAVIDDAFNGRTSHEAFEEGGVVKVVVVEKTALGRFVRYERLKVLEYRPPDPSKQPMRAYWFQGGSTKGYVDERGRRPSHRGWRSPVPGAPVTSHFNPKRMHPVLKKVMPHNGTDFGAPSGTPVYAAYRGKVELVGPHGASGNLVLIDHPGAVQTGYAHLSRFAPGLDKGDSVGTRQLIGYVGSTGRSTGPHLHFSAKRDGKFFDALELKLDALELLPVDDRAAFLQQKQTLDQVLEAMPLPEPPPEEPTEPQELAGEEPEGADQGAESDGEEAPEEKKQSSGKSEKKSSSAEKREEDEGDDLLGPDLSGDLE